ncbi:hypothetical protein AOQ84DRAFT_390683 [Glonium stellatum]|uniref:Uncharacterized protein n=1 Tax=Glonium stellatum TaxID=574774 RepID=A0A8E2EVU6_9PEZI|nr:hypothetical protein AOQ84DRAFT_390683 [Glonium stellatum]
MAIDLGAPIVGCAEVDCPTTASTNETSADCRVADHTFTAIGLSNFQPPTNISSDDFTWTEGIETYDNLDPSIDFDRIFERNFYLGTPPAFAQSNSSRYGFCALFFTQVTNDVKFDSSPIETAVGTCDEAMTQNCVNSLLEQAVSAAASFANQNSDEACGNLLSNFQNNLSSACPQFATGDNWQGLAVKTLTGPDAPTPLTEAQNATTNCYPTLPKSNLLTRVAAFNTSGTALQNSTVANFYRITPILTLFYPTDGDGDAVLQKPEALFTCLKVTGETNAATNTSSPKDKNSGGGSEATPWSVLTLATIGLVGVLSAMALSF